MTRAERRRETLSAGPGERGERLDLFIARSLEGVSRKAVKRALDGGQVFVDGKVVRRAGYSLSGNDTITLTLDLPAAESSPPLPDILLWDADLLAINKPPGLSSHPTVGGRANALDLVRSFLRDRGKDDSPILLHRLDADTSGVLLFALTVAANRDLYRQLAGREVEKTYLCLVAGSPPDAFGVENHLKSGVRSRTVAVQSGGQKAVTEFRTLKRGQGFTLVEARPHTGRTHQIRVHLAGKGFPLLGDRLYGGPVAITLGGGTLPVRRHLLHAFRLAFRYPGTGERKVIEAPVPEDFKVLIGETGNR